ncbi:MAG: flagellin-like protein [Ruminiclostridium sp.]|nr:flagellin-like protein [Ruminiclostridium sp.]
MSKFSALKLMALNKIAKLIKDEKGEVNIVAIVLLIGIVVVLAIVFKDAILDLLNNLFSDINNQTSGIWT